MSKTLRSDPIEGTGETNAPTPLPPLLANLLDNDSCFTTDFTYDALDRPTEVNTPDAHQLAYRYDALSQLQKITLDNGDTNTAPQIQAFTYNARGQRKTIRYGNGMQTVYDYDPLTFQMTHITTQTSKGNQLQALTYQYDPEDNVVHLSDEAPVAMSQSAVPLEVDYTYNPLYQLIEAGGREIAGMWEQTQQNQDQVGNKLLPLQGSYPLQNYTQQFDYDESNNLKRITHTDLGTSLFQQMTFEEKSNRLESISFHGTGGVDQQSIDYDPNGNQLTLGRTPDLVWNYQDQIQKVSFEEGRVETYTYDQRRNRIRKLKGTQETIYLGDFEVHREWDSAGTLIKEWHVIRLMAETHCNAEWRYWLTGHAPETEAEISYQLGNRLGSAMVEVDSHGQLLSYQEYYPYGGTSLLAAMNKAVVDLKRYRYSGEEQDAGSGLYYYGARYYSSWQARWLSPDPAGTIDGLNLYGFVGGNPITQVDFGGTTKTTAPGGSQSTVTMSQEKIKSSKFRVARRIQRRTNTTRNILTMKFKKGKKSTYISMLSLGMGNKKLTMAKPYDQRQRGHTEGVAAAILQDKQVVDSAGKTIPLDPADLVYLSSTNEACSGKGAEQCGTEVVPEILKVAPSAAFVFQNPYQTGQNQAGGFSKATNAFYQGVDESDKESEDEAEFYHVSEIADSNKDTTAASHVFKVRPLKDFLADDADKQMTSNKRPLEQTAPAKRKVFTRKKNAKTYQNKRALYKALEEDQL